MKKKILSVLTVLLVLTALSACNANQGRGDKYTYDFKDFMNIEIFGPEGEAYIQITPKEISVADFSSEEEFIKVKKVIDQLNLSYIPGSNNSSGLTVSKGDHIKTGDMIVIKPTTSLLSSDKAELAKSIDLNIEQYDYVVESLPETKKVDLFSSDIVKFYGLITNEIVYVVNKDNTTISDELKENLIYKITTSDKTLKEGQTIMTVQNGLKQELIDNGNYYNNNIYYAKQNLSVEYSTAEKVLNKIVNPIDFNNLKQESKDIIKKSLYKYIKEKLDYNVENVCNIQQLNSQNENDPYKYYIIYTTLDGENVQRVYRTEMKLLFINNEELEVLSCDKTENIPDTYLNTNYNGAIRLIDFIQTEGE